MPVVSAIGIQGPTGASGSGGSTVINIANYPGADPTGTLDSTAAFQTALDAAWATVRSINAGNEGALFTTVKVVIPGGGKYLISRIEMQDGIWLIGDSNVELYGTNNSYPILRMGGYYNRVEGISFANGRNAIAIYGPSYRGGNIGNPTAESTNTINNCNFRLNRGPAIYMDSTADHIPSGARLTVENCDIAGSTFYWGCFDACTFINCKGTALLTSGGGSYPTPAVDDQGKTLSFFNTGNNLQLINCTFSPAVDGALNPQPTWIQGNGLVSSKNVRYGGEAVLPIMRVRQPASGFTYNGRALESSNLLPSLSFDNDQMWSSGGTNWLEIYDVFPALIDLRMPMPSQTGTGREYAQLYSSWGTWIDSTSCPSSSYALTDKGSLVIRSYLFSATALKFRTSTNSATFVGTDVTDKLLPYFVRDLYDYRTDLGTVKKNNFPSGKISIDSCSAISGTLSYTGSPDTTLGRSIYGLTNGTGSDGNAQADFTGVGSGIAAGIKNFSLYIKADFAEVVTVIVAGNKLEILPFSGSNVWQRSNFSYYHDGSAHTLSLQFSNVPAGKTVYPALFCLNDGDSPAPWLEPAISTTEDLVRQERLAASTPSGSPANADITWNSAPSSTDALGWVYTSDSAWTPIRNLVGAAGVTVAGSNIVLTADQYANPLILLTGTPAATRTIALPDRAGIIRIFKNSTGSDQTLKAGAGATVTLADTKSVVVYTDGATNLYALTSQA
jgi:hypothetical protein